MSTGTVRKVSRQGIKMVTTSLKMEDTNTKTDLYKECFYNGSLSECINHLNATKNPLHKVLGFRKEINGITVEIAFQWSVDGSSETMIGYANDIRTSDGGTHINGVKDSLTIVLNRLAKKTNVVKEEDIILSWEHVKTGLTCIVSVVVPNPQFEGPTHRRLGNLHVWEVVYKSVQEYLMKCFELHPDILKSIISKSFNAYKTALAIKRAKELSKSNRVSTVPEKKMTISSSGKNVPDCCFIGGADSSSGPPKHNGETSFQRKRKQEQNWSSGDVVKSLETDSSFEKNNKKPKTCVVSPSSHSLFSSRRAVLSNSPNPKDLRKRSPKDVTINGSNQKKPVIPVGPSFQAEIPVWIAPTKKGKFYGSPGDSQTLKWLGTGVWPTYSLKKKVHYKKVGEGRSDDCSCTSPGSTDCFKRHIKEARELLEKEIGRAFNTWKFDELDEEVVCKSWTVKEEQRFSALVRKHPLRNSEGFWELALKAFPRKSEKDLRRYYYNVFLINRMNSSLAKRSVDHYESDDDHNGGFLEG